MNEVLLNLLVFPPRSMFRKVEMVAVFIEPRVGSGERLCVGVVVVLDDIVTPDEVPDIRRMLSIYGDAAEGLVYFGKIALNSLSDCIRQVGFEAAQETWVPPATGLFLGKPLTTAASTLEHALHLSLSTYSSFYAGAVRTD